MDSFSTILAESLVGMGITTALLALLALIFHFIGKFGRKEGTEGPPPTMKREDDISNVLPFIATAVYLYRASEVGGRAKLSPRRAERIEKRPLLDSAREEWKRSGRRDYLR
jgi:Na+-transporting methylmalonyl-CoA/oxaloacetate decarboxylase gamma subunit